MPGPAIVRATYRHGDLRHALIAAGVELARAGGPDAVVLREATRRAGVVPNAAYRHFDNREDLLAAVRAAALGEVARAMERELSARRRSPTMSKGAAPARTDKAQAARDAVRAIGTAYMRFAQTETGLFRTAFGSSVEVGNAPESAKSGPDGMNPFQLLGAALDQLVEAGAMPAERRPDAEYLAWAAVHGLALFFIEGPLRGGTRKHAEALGQQLLDMVERGLA